MRAAILFTIAACGRSSPHDAACTDTFYADVDGDGHGDSQAPVTDCAAPSGYTTTSDDCDDDSHDIHPGANETCNALDDDCDLAVDEDAIDAAVWYADADGDGFGDDGAVTTACSAAGDQVAVAGDCADSDAAVNPDADEICNDVDDDCDALVDSEDPSLAQGTVWYADADGDGYGDPATGTYACEEPSGRTTDTSDCDDSDGAVHPNADEICDGTDHDCDGGVCVAIDLSTADAKLVGEESSDRAGSSVSGAGDVDGDGHDDLLVGAWNHGGTGVAAGAAYLVLGPVTGTLDLSGADAKLVGEEEDDAAYGVSGAGDVNDDGHDDLLIGAFWNDEGGSNAGAAYVVLGPVTGILDLSLADAKLVGEAKNDEAGRSVSGAGDVDGDGRDDLLVGAYGNAEGGYAAGAAYLLLGPATGTLDLSLADAKIVGEKSNDRAGVSVSGAGDVDADGRDDLLVGADGATGAGAAYLVLGPVTGTIDLASQADAELVGEMEQDAAGDAVSGAGDVDGDGHDDSLVGAAGNDEGGGLFSDAGAAYLVLGPVTGTLDLSLADGKLVGEPGSDYTGISVSGAGDVDADGHDDLLVGTQLAVFEYAHLVLGPVTGTLDLSLADATFVGEGAEDFASAVSGAGDVDADGRADIVIGAAGNAEGGSLAGAAYLLYGGGL